MVKQLDNINLHSVLGTNSKNTAETARPQTGKPGEFEQVIRAELQGQASVESPEGPRFSKHAQKRIAERNLDMDGDEFLKLKGAIDKLKNKGGKDSLVITSKGAYIVDVANDTVVTAMSKEDLGENVFTKIDSTLFIN